MRQNLLKKEKGQKLLDAADRLLSTAASRVRQPIESLFNCFEEKTKFEIRFQSPNPV